MYTGLGQGIFILSITFDKRIAVVTSACAIQATVIGCMFAYGIFFNALETEFGWSRTLLSACSSCAFVMMGVLAIFAGRLSDYVDPRLVLGVSGILFGLGYALMYFINEPWQLFVIYGLFVGVGLSTHDVVTLSVIAQWFNKRRGVMTGVVKVGTAVGQIIVPLVATALILSFGWRLACVTLGVLAALILSLAARGMCERRQKPTPCVATAERELETAKSGIAFPIALRSKQLWILCLIQFMFFPSLVTIPVHLVVHATDLGLSASTAAGLLSVIGAASIFGRLFVGFAFDTLGGRFALGICFTFLIASLFWLRLIDNPTVLYGFATLYGIGHGGLFTVVSPTVAEYFGLLAHSSIFGVIVFCGTLGGALGPLIAGHIFDSTGSYSIAFNTLAIMACIGLISTLFLTPLLNKPG